MYNLNTADDCISREYREHREIMEEIKKNARRKTDKMFKDMEKRLIAESRAESLEKVRAEGRAEGANDQKREIAMRLLNEGFDDNSIIRLVKINPAELAKIKDNM